MSDIEHLTPKIANKVYDKEWSSAIEDLATMNLPGLRVKCPACQQVGTIVSKWERGFPLNLQIAHKNGDKPLLLCTVGRENTQTLRRYIHISEDDIETILVGRHAYVLFSGGRDSLCTLVFMNSLAQNLGVRLRAVHVDTTAGFPEVTAYVKSVCATLNVPLEVVRPIQDYFELAKRWGIPGVKARWCCKTLKIGPLRKFFNSIKDPKVVFDGIRASESPTRASYLPVWFHPSFRCFSVSALFYWTDADIERYITELDLPRSPANSLGTSAECWCGAYKKRSDFEKLLDVHPDIFEKLVEVEQASKTGFTFVYENGQRMPLPEIARMHVRNSEG